MAARFSTEEVLDLVTANNDYRVSDSESSEKQGKVIYAYCGERSFSSVDIESFHKVALSRPELREVQPLSAVRQGV